MRNKNIFESVQFLNEGILISTKRGRNKIYENTSKIDKAIKSNIEMCEKSIPLLKEFFQVAESICKKYDKNLYDKAVKLTEKLVKLDYDRGTEQELADMSMSYIRNHMSKFFNKADWKNEDVKKEWLELEEKCSKDGEYVNRLIRCYNEISKIVSKYEKLTKVYDGLKLKEQREVIEQLGIELSWFNNQTFMTASDTSSILPKNKKAALADIHNNLYHAY